MFSSTEPQSHPLAYSYHLRDSWLQDGVRICTLRDYIVAHPPSGDADWEIHVDNKANELWGKEADVRDGYLMLSQLPMPSAPKVMEAALRDFGSDPLSGSVNAYRASRGVGPVPGWEAVVAAGYMQPPPHQELPANEIELIDRGGPRADKLQHELRSEQSFCDPSMDWYRDRDRHECCHRWHHHAVPCNQAHRFPFHRNVLQYLPYMGGGVYVEGHAEPVQGHILVPVDRYIKLINTRDKWGRPVDHTPE